MKKILSLALVCVLMVGVLLTLASCGNISQSYADKVNKAVEDGEPLTKDEVMKALGDGAVWQGMGGDALGVIMAVKGCSSMEEIEELVKNKEEADVIIVAVVDGKAVKAAFGSSTDNDFAADVYKELYK